MRKFYKFISIVAMLTASVSAYADTFTISSAAELAAFRDAVNNGDTYEGDVIELTTDIDLGGMDWTPIANTTDVESYMFLGVFDAKGYTISNFQVSVKRSGLSAKYAMAGLFGINCGTIKNLKVTNAEVYSESAYGDTATGSSAGAIAGVNGKGGIINNCCVYNSNIHAHAAYSAASSSNYVFAGGIVGAQYSGNVIKNCYVNEDVVITSTRAANNKNRLYVNTISNSWIYYGFPSFSDIVSENPQTNCCSSAADYEAWRAAKNEAAFLYCNLGVKLNGEVPEPYYWDENGITPDIYYVLMIDENKSQYPERKRSAATFSDKNEKMTTYTYRTEVGGDGNTYTLFAAGSTATMVAHLEGPKATGDGSVDSYGYYVKHIGDMSAQIGSVLSEDKNYSAATDRYERTQEFSIVMPAAMTTIWYEANTYNTTALDVVEIAKATVTVADGKVIVSAPQGNVIVVADMMGRVVYNATATDEVTEIELAKGIYVVNGTKVAVR